VHSILIVDDEHNIRHILDFSLGAEGFRVIAAGNGEDAFQLAISEQPDLIILDIMMPGEWDGIETCRHLKQDSHTSAIPVVLLSARTERRDRERGRVAGADGYITKPFSPQHVVETVHSLLGVRKD
jgi:two-component system alkaline phosphatase synthesis response regulator PhoP